MQLVYQKLLPDDVRKGSENINAKSILTVTVVLRNLNYCCELRKTTSDGIREKVKADKNNFRLSWQERRILFIRENKK